MKEHEHATENNSGADYDGHHANMAAYFQKRFWILLVLTLPILALSQILQKLLGLGEAIRFSGDLYVLHCLLKCVPRGHQCGTVEIEAMPKS